MPSNRRLLTLGGAVFVGVAATAMFAAPANATTAKVTGDVDCATKDGYTITWTITSDYPSVKLTITDVKTKPNTPLSKNLEGTTIKGQPAFRTVTQVVPTDTKEATLSFHPEWSNGHQVKKYEGSVDVAGKCTPPCPPEGMRPPGGGNGGKPPKPGCPPEKTTPPTVPPTIPPTAPPTEPPTSTSPSPSGGTGGGGESPTPTPSASKSAPPALPVTGSQAAIYGGGSVLLLGAGAGLFLAARRRRIQFEA
jgi:hypothetical protein